MKALSRLLRVLGLYSHSAVSDLFTNKLNSVLMSLHTDRELSDAEIEELDRLAKLKCYLAQSRARSAKTLECLFLTIALVVFGSLCFVRLPRTSVDIEIETTALSLTTEVEPSPITIPGENGQSIALKELDILGVEDSLPPTAVTGGNLLLHESDSSRNVSTPSDPESRQIRLQEVSIPANNAETLSARIIYGTSGNGVEIETAGPVPVTTLLGQMVPVASQIRKPAREKYAIRPVQVSGRHLSLELHPSFVSKQLTIIRDLKISEVGFDESGHSMILGGKTYIRLTPNGRVNLQPGERLVLESRTPMLLRELTFSGDKLKARLSAPEASSILAGDDQLRDLRPSVFEWIYSRWPTQLYASLSALLGAWLAFRTWMKGSE